MFGTTPPYDGADGDLPLALKAQSGQLALTTIISILILCAFQGAAVVATPALQRLAQSSRGTLEVINELYTLLLYVCSFLLPYLFYARTVGYSLRSIVRDPPYPPVLAASVGISLGLSVAGLALSIAAGIFFSIFGLYPMEMPIVFPTNPLALALFVLNLAVVPALIEEFSVRGIVMGSLRRYGDRFAIVISALLFALLHRNMTQFPNAFVLGLALGYFMIKTNSIWTSIAIHFVNNALALVLSAFTGGMTDVQALSVQGFSSLLYLVAAGCGILYLRVLRRVDSSLAPSSCPLPRAQLYRLFLCNFPMLLLLLLFGWLIFLNFS